MAFAGRNVLVPRAQCEAGAVQLRPDGGGDEGIVAADRHIRLVGVIAAPAVLLAAVVRQLGEQLEVVEHVEAEAAEHAGQVLARLDRRAVIMLADLPVAADRPGQVVQPVVAIIIAVHRAALPEISAAQRAGGDDAATGGGVQPRLAGNHIFRLAVAGDIARVLDQVDAAVLPRARPGAAHAIAAHDIAAQQRAAAPVGELDPAGQRRAPVLVVAVGGLAIADLALQPLVFAVEDEVDDACHRVRPIDRRCTAGDDLDALHQPLRDGVHVHRPLRNRPHRSMPVEQHQRARGAQRPQVDRVDPARAAAQHALRVGRGDAACDGRDLVDEIGDVRRGGGLDVGKADHRHRRRRVIAVAHDARSRDRDRPAITLGGGCLAKLVGGVGHQFGRQIGRGGGGGRHRLRILCIGRLRPGQQHGAQQGAAHRPLRRGIGWKGGRRQPVLYEKLRRRGMLFGASMLITGRLAVVGNTPRLQDRTHEHTHMAPYG